MTSVLLILNDPPYGSERTYNGLRLAGALARHAGNSVRVYLMGDAAAAAHRRQKVPQGYYNVETMLGIVVRHSGAVGVCGSCMDARGMTAEDLAAGCHRGSLEELTEWTLAADQVIAF